MALQAEAPLHTVTCTSIELALHGVRGSQRYPEHCYARGFTYNLAAFAFSATGWSLAVVALTSVLAGQRFEPREGSGAFQAKFALLLCVAIIGGACMLGSFVQAFVEMAYVQAPRPLRHVYVGHAMSTLCCLLYWVYRAFGDEHPLAAEDTYVIGATLVYVPATISSYSAERCSKLGREKQHPPLGCSCCP